MKRLLLVLAAFCLLSLALAAVDDGGSVLSSDDNVDMPLIGDEATLSSDGSDVAAVAAPTGGQSDLDERILDEDALQAQLDDAAREQAVRDAEAEAAKRAAEAERRRKEREAAEAEAAARRNKFKPAGHLSAAEKQLEELLHTLNKLETNEAELRRRVADANDEARHRALKRQVGRIVLDTLHERSGQREREVQQIVNRVVNILKQELDLNSYERPRGMPPASTGAAGFGRPQLDPAVKERTDSVEEEAEQEAEMELRKLDEEIQVEKARDQAGGEDAGIDDGEQEDIV